MHGQCYSSPCTLQDLCVTSYQAALKKESGGSDHDVTVTLGVMNLACLLANCLTRIISLVLFINNAGDSSVDTMTCFLRESKLQKICYVHCFGVGALVKLLPICLCFFAGCIHFHASSSFSTVINETTEVCAFICNVNTAALMFPGATASVTMGMHLPLLLVLHPLYSC